MSHATHANAALTPRARLRLARLIVDHGWPSGRAAERYDVSWRTAKKWADRYRAEGPAGMATGPRGRTVSRTAPRSRWSARSCTCAGSSGWGRSRSATGSAMPSSTVHAVLVRCRLNRLTHIDRATGEPIRRYEHEHPGDLIHVDVKKLGKVPDGGGWRYVGRQQGKKNSSATATHRRPPQQVARPGDRDLLSAHRDR